MPAKVGIALRVRRSLHTPCLVLMRFASTGLPSVVPIAISAAALPTVGSRSARWLASSAVSRPLLLPASRRDPRARHRLRTRDQATARRPRARGPARCCRSVFPRRAGTDQASIGPRRTLGHPTCSAARARAHHCSPSSQRPSRQALTPYTRDNELAPRPSRSARSALASAATSPRPTRRDRRPPGDRGLRLHLGVQSPTCCASAESSTVLPGPPS